MGARKPVAKKSISAQLRWATAGLQKLEKRIRSTDIDSRALRDFRKAIDRIRLVAWGVYRSR